MPEFELIGANGPRWKALDSFTQGYIEAMFFTEDEELGGLGFDDLSQTALVTIIAECSIFQLRMAADLDIVCGQDDYDYTQAGRDFWFTRNGHGVGYWDRKQLERTPISRDALTNAAHSCGERHSYYAADIDAIEYD